MMKLFIASYINICVRRDPKIDECVIKSINNMKNNLCEGIPELEVPPIGPVSLDKLVFFDAHNIKFYLTNVQLNWCNFNVTHLHTDTLQYDIDILLNQIQINSTYDLDIRLLIPFVQRGSFYFNTGM